MWSFLKILAWGSVTAIVMVIVFVRTPNSGENSGGKQASQIITAGTGGLATVINSLTGGK